MKLIRLDKTGHTELDLTPEEMIRELERDMNTPGKVAIAEQPGQAPTYLRRPQDAKELDPATRVTVAPQLQGG